MNQTRHPAVDLIVDRIKENPQVERIILFGSRARGDARERSDFDLAVVGPALSRREWAEIWRIVDDAPTLLAIDLVRFEEASEPLRESITRDGITLYERATVH